MLYFGWTTSFNVNTVTKRRAHDFDNPLVARQAHSASLSDLPICMSAMDDVGKVLHQPVKTSFRVGLRVMMTMMEEAPAAVLPIDRTWSIGNTAAGASSIIVIIT